MSAIEGLQSLRHLRVLMTSGEEHIEEIVVIFYLLDGDSEPYRFQKLSTVAEVPDGVWIDGESDRGPVKGAIHGVRSISSEPVYREEIDVL